MRNQCRGLRREGTVVEKSRLSLSGHTRKTSRGDSLGLYVSFHPPSFSVDLGTTRQTVGQVEGEKGETRPKDDEISVVSEVQGTLYMGDLL